MKFHCGSNVDANTGIKAVIERLTLRAFAEEGGEGTKPKEEVAVEEKSVSINYEDLIAKARREEKEKQYKNIERLKTQINTLTEQHNNDLLKVADLEKQLEEAGKKLTSAGSGDSEELKSLKKTVKDLEAKKKELEAKVAELEANKPVSREEVEKEVRAELEAEYEVKAYKVNKLAELKDELLVPELVMGDTKEDIDKSIKAALARSEEIRKSLGATKEPNKRTPKSPSNPSMGPSSKEIDLDYLAKLDVRSPEYAELRRQMGLK